MHARKIRILFWGETRTLALKEVIQSRKLTLQGLENSSVFWEHFLLLQGTQHPDLAIRTYTGSNATACNCSFRGLLLSLSSMCICEYLTHARTHTQYWKYESFFASVLFSPLNALMWQQPAPHWDVKKAAHRRPRDYSWKVLGRWGIPDALTIQNNLWWWWWCLCHHWHQSREGPLKGTTFFLAPSTQQHSTGVLFEAITNNTAHL